MRRVRLSAAVLVAASLVLAGCGGDDEPSEDYPEAQEIEGGSTLDSTWPLTGLPVEGDESSAQKHPGHRHQDRQHRVERAADRARLGGHGGRGAGRGRPDPARGLLLLPAAREGRPGPVDAGQRHRHRLAGPRLRGHQRRGRPDHRPHQGRRHHVLPGGRQGRLPRHRPQRAVQRLRRTSRRSPRGSTRTSDVPTTTSSGARRPTCRRARRPRTSARRSAVTRRTGSSRTARTTTSTATPPTAMSSRPTPCWCCGCRSATPATPTRPATRCPRPSSRARARRCSSTTVGWCAPPGARPASTDSSRSPRRPARLDIPAGHTWLELVPAGSQGNVTFK